MSPRHAAYRGDSFYTLLESAKLAGVEPRGYLREAAEAALKGEAPLLPHVHRERLKQRG